MPIVQLDPPRDPHAGLKARAVVAAEMLERTLEALALPEGYRARFDRDRELTWNYGSPGQSIAGYIERHPGDPADAGQLMAEIRVHLDAPEPRASVFAQVGERYLGRHQPLPDTPAFLKAASFDALRLQLVDTLTDAVDRVLNPPCAPAGPAPTP